MPRPVLLYDGDCPLCEQLAGFVRRRADDAMDVQAWQSRNNDQVEANGIGSIGMLIDEKLLIGAEAWAKLIEMHPDLRSLGWLAERLGLRNVLATSVGVAAQVAKRVCGGCRLPWYLRD